MNTRKSLPLAVAVALATAAVAPAFAANIAVPAGSQLPVGGATATDRSLAIGWLDDLCDAATTPATPNNAGFNIEVFTTIATFAPGTTRNYAIACRMATTANGGAASQDVVLLKYSGGSGTGVTPVAAGTALATSGSANWVDYANCRDGAGAPIGGASAANIAAAGNIPAYRLYTNCPIAATPIVPKAGVSDVEPRLQVDRRRFVAADQPAGRVRANGHCGVAEPVRSSADRARSVGRRPGPRQLHAGVHAEPHSPASARSVQERRYRCDQPLRRSGRRDDPDPAGGARSRSAAAATARARRRASRRSCWARAAARSTVRVGDQYGL